MDHATTAAVTLQAADVAAASPAAKPRTSLLLACGTRTRIINNHQWPPQELPGLGAWANEPHPPHSRERIAQ